MGEAGRPVGVCVATLPEAFAVNCCVALTSEVGSDLDSKDLRQAHVQIPSPSPCCGMPLGGLPCERARKEKLESCLTPLFPLFPLVGL